MKDDKTLEDIILQHSTRGMDKIQELYPQDHCALAASAFLSLPRGAVFIYTGFYVAGFAETDGPLGAYFLAKSFAKLGFEPVMITDTFCQDYFCEFETIYIPLKGLSEEEYHGILERHKPVCHLSIERCGQNAQGDYCNSRGTSVKDFTAPVDELFILGDQKALSIGIGDGGNEIGMGSFERALQNKVDFADYCVVKCDFPIIASVSNWGGYALIAQLQKSLGVELLPTFEAVEAYMDYILQKGCVDGIKRECTKSVDGKEWRIEAEILRDLKQYALRQI